jgi:hypothetical protein
VATAIGIALSAAMPFAVFAILRRKIGIHDAAVAGATPDECWIDLASLSANDAVTAWRSTPRVFDWPGYAAPKELDTASLFPLQLAIVVDVIVVLDDVGPARFMERRAG